MLMIVIAIVLFPLTAVGVGYMPDHTPEYQIRFGWMKKRADGSYYVYRETRQIPLKLKETGFRWGYTIHSKNLYFSTYSIDYGPESKDATQGQEILVQMMPTEVYDGKYWRWTANDPEDPVGKQKIEVYINGTLFETIHFTITKPSEDIRAQVF